jgi:hypothetical protein
MIQFILNYLYLLLNSNIYTFIYKFYKILNVSYEFYYQIFEILIEFYKKKMFIYSLVYKINIFKRKYI